jgi:hypothetical protein
MPVVETHFNAFGITKFFDTLDKNWPLCCSTNISVLAGAVFFTSG